MHKLAFLGFGAIVAGMVFGAVTVDPARPARSSGLERASPAPTETAASAFLPLPLSATTPSPTTAIEPPTIDPTWTVIPLTSTPVPPTAIPTPGPPAKTGGASAPSVNAWSVAVVDEASGALLYGRDPHRRMAPASLTKIFTALVALKYGDVKKPITVQFDSTELVDSTLMGIKPGETYSLEDLLYGLMLPSGNDAALAIANTIGGTESQFATMMNTEASRLGLTDSHFVNAHGLDAPGHYSSAYDLAMASREGMLHSDEFGALTRAKAWEVRGTRGYWVYNLNRFLRSYQGSDGVKIGYTDNSGPAIVASASRNGHRVYVVLLHCGDIVGDSVPLFNWVFANYSWPTTPVVPASSPSPTSHP